MSDEEDLGAMAWPGFVDILSSVIIMFVFFVLVVASALFFHILIFKNQIMSEISTSMEASASAKELADTNRFLMEKIEDLQDKLKISEEQSQENELQLHQVSTEFAESKNQEIRHLDNENSIIIFFGKDSISVTEENETILSEIIKEYEEKLSSTGTKISITAAKNANAKSEMVSKKLAISRMLNVRNLFLETNIKTEDIKPSVSFESDIDGSYNWVKINFEGK